MSERTWAIKMSLERWPGHKFEFRGAEEESTVDRGAAGKGACAGSEGRRVFPIL